MFSSRMYTRASFASVSAGRPFLSSFAVSPLASRGGFVVVGGARPLRFDSIRSDHTQYEGNCLVTAGMSFLLSGLLKCHTQGVFWVFSQYTLPSESFLNSFKSVPPTAE